METRELSETNQSLEKDVILNSESSAAAVEATENAPASAEAVTNPIAEEPVAEVQEIEAPAEHKTKPEIIEALKQLLEVPIEQVKDSVTPLRLSYLAIRREEVAQQKAEFLENGNEEAAFVERDDEDDIAIKQLLEQFKARRAEFNAAQEAQRAKNLEKKQAIIAEINKICDDPDNVNRQYNRVQQLQQEFKAIGPVPANADTDVWKQLQQTMEKFYDVLKINKQLRDLDFKKNLEIKQRMCAEAEALDDETDVVAAFKKLQDLHAAWRETGPVAKELREDIWARFKNASSVINKKYQQFFEERKGREKENADAKLALCERIEQISTDNIKSYAAWDEATKQIIALQEEWKKLGFASRKLNSELFARFRKKCDEFFALKADFFKRTKETMAANLARKIELCEKAEALKDSTDWKETTDQLVALQKEWKTIGPVVKKHSDAVWKRFIAACDAFFDQKKKQHSSVHAVEHENLKAKKDVIAQLKAIVDSEEQDNAEKQVRELMSRWQEIGHVPFKEKDKVYAEYRETLDKAFEKFHITARRNQMANFETSISQMDGDSDKMSHERERLVRTYEQRCNELKTYENNLGFFNAKSQTGSSWVKELERKMAKLRDEIELLEQKIKLIDQKA